MLEEEKDSHLGNIIYLTKQQVVIVDNASHSEYFRSALRKRALGMVAENISRLPVYERGYTNAVMIQVS